MLLPYLPLSITGLLVIGQLLAGSRIGAVEAFVALALVILVVLRQFVTLIDNVRLVRQLRQSQEQLSQQAFNDSLTGLANRALFRDRLDHAVQVHRSDHYPLGLIFCDLDDFKLVNDGLGHAAGDELLQAVAGRLLNCVQPTDTAARLGGDEFAVLLEGASDDPRAVAERILAALSQPFLLRDLASGEGTVVRVGASIGVAVMDPAEPNLSPDALLARVDAAMYAAKRRGKNQLVTFRQDMGDETASGLLGDLRVLLATKRADPLMRANGSIEVMYQPVVRLDSTHVVALEALVRWQHPRHGLLPAELLLSSAEDAGMLGALEERVLDTACRDIGLLRRRPGLEQVAVHVNLSGQRTGDPRLISTVQETLDRHQLPGEALILEITETGRVPDLEVAAQVLTKIRGLDVRAGPGRFRRRLQRAQLPAATADRHRQTGPLADHRRGRHPGGGGAQRHHHADPRPRPRTDRRGRRNPRPDAGTRRPGVPVRPGLPLRQAAVPRRPRLRKPLRRRLTHRVPPQTRPTGLGPPRDSPQRVTHPCRRMAGPCHRMTSDGFGWAGRPDSALRRPPCPCTNVAPVSRSMEAMTTLPSAVDASQLVQRWCKVAIRPRSQTPPGFSTTVRRGNPRSATVPHPLRHRATRSPAGGHRPYHLNHAPCHPQLYPAPNSRSPRYKIAKRQTARRDRIDRLLPVSPARPHAVVDLCDHERLLHRPPNTAAPTHEPAAGPTRRNPGHPLKPAVTYRNPKPPAETRGHLRKPGATACTDVTS